MTTLQDYYNIYLPACQVLFANLEKSFFKYQLVSFSLPYKYIIAHSIRLVKSFFQKTFS
uniref:Uncharacterized protein n=1 Tax=Podoviridae sp. ctKzN3 TaxID=2826553 RepID=A0A8S5NFW5_9CAUD|nr:MAG TPA: hypothetical protein [Podoviridae sp. ctKzN3]